MNLLYLFAACLQLSVNNNLHWHSDIQLYHWTLWHRILHC